MAYAVLAIAVALIAAVWLLQQQQETAKKMIRDEGVDTIRRFTEEDLGVFGVEMMGLDLSNVPDDTAEEMRRHYDRAMENYEAAKHQLYTLIDPADISSVTEHLEYGQYALACVRACLAGEPMPARRPPCFFNPQHGTATDDVDWALPDAAPTAVPVCAADARRVRAGEDPATRTVALHGGAVPYWDAGPAFRPYAMGYFNAYAGQLPAFFVMSMLNSMWLGGMLGYDMTADMGPITAAGTTGTTGSAEAAGADLTPRSDTGDPALGQA